MHHIVQASLRNRLLVIVLWSLFVAWGAVELQRLPIDAVPDVTNVQVQIITDSPGYAAEEVERLVTVPVEQSMGGLPAIEQVRSLTRSGLSVVTVVFHDGTDIFHARQLVGERLVEARERIPEGLGKPELAPVSSGLGEIYQFEVRGKGKTAMELREALDWQVIPRLRNVPGVVEVNSFGGELRTFQVTLDPIVMAERGVDVDEIVESIESSNRNAAGGLLELNDESLVVRGEGLLQNRSDIENVVIRTEEDGSVLRIADVSTVEPAPMLRYGAVTRDGTREAVCGIAMMLLGANSREVARAVDAEVREIDASLPDIELEPFYDRTALVDRTIRTVEHNLVFGGGLVMVVLLLLMGSLRAGILVALSIPLSFLGAVIGMRLIGLSGNLMSLGALDFGILVDGAVVMVEHIATAMAGRRLRGHERYEAVGRASGEMARPTVFGVLIIGIVYIPILTLQGVEARMFAPMAWTVVFALGVALACALTLTPVLASLFLGNVSAKKAPLFRLAEWLYGKVLPGLMRAPVSIAVVALALMVASGLVFIRLGAVFLPSLDEGDLALQIARQPEVGLEESLREAKLVEKLLLENFPEVKTVISKTGRPEIATDPMGIDFSDVFVMLHPRDEWGPGATKETLETDIKAYLEAQVAGVGISLSQPIELRMNELLEGVRADIGISLFGDDLDELAERAEAIAAVVRAIPGAGDVETSKDTGLPQLRIVLRRETLARHGIRAEEVLETVATVAGLPVGLVFEGERRFEIRLRLAPEWRTDPQKLGEVRVVAKDGHAVPLAELVDIREDHGPAAISREKGKRRSVIQVNVRGRDLVSFVAEARAAVAQAVPLPGGWYTEWGGQFKHFEAASRRLAIAVPAALLLIFVLLNSAFRSTGRAIFIYLCIPMAASGGVLALWIRDYPFSISAAVGFIALFGVAVMNGVVLMTTIQEHEAAGHTSTEAAFRAAKERLRAVLMTAFAGIIGFLPMAISTGEGAEVQRPLASVVIGGLVTATMLTLLVLPPLYSGLARLGRRSRRLTDPSSDGIDAGA